MSSRTSRKTSLSRRRFMRRVAAGASLASSAALLPGIEGAPAPDASEDSRPSFKPTAEHCILLWLGGGAAQIDTWDPKGRGDPAKRIPGTAYESIPTAIRGEKVCVHLRRTAPRLDRAALVRTTHHNVVDEHAAATNRMHTGRPTSGTVVYPSMGSVVSHELGPAQEGVPTYVVMGYPNLTRGPGFLGPRHGYVYLTDTKTGPAGLVRHASITPVRQRRRDALVHRLRDRYRDRNTGDAAVAEFVAVEEAAQRLSGPEFMSAFRLEDEPAALRASYGSEFGQRCLLGRRLVQRGVRFIEISHNLNFINGTGWDTHNEGQAKQHELIEELDKAFSTLLVDLETHRLLEKTLIIISTEFGRPAGFDGRGGRGHQSTTFSTVLAGGGLRTGQVVGETDELAKKIVRQPVSVPDLFATAYRAMGIDPARELYAGDRPVPITDMGRPIPQLFS